MSNSFWIWMDVAHGILLSHHLCPWDFSGKNTRVGCYFLLQRIFLTQGRTCVSCIARQILNHWTTREALKMPCCAMLSCFSHAWLCDAMDCSPPGFSVHGTLQARILEWVAMSSSRRSSWPRDRTCISLSLLHWQIGSWPLALPTKSKDAIGRCNYYYLNFLLFFTKPLRHKTLR